MIKHLSCDPNAEAEQLYLRAAESRSGRCSTRWSVFYRTRRSGQLVSNWPFGYPFGWYNTRELARIAAAGLNRARILEGKPEWAQYKVVDHGSHTWDSEWDDSHIS